MTKRRLADLALTLIAFVWGVTFIMVQDAIQSLPPFLFLTIRFGSSALLIFLYMRLVRVNGDSRENFGRELRYGVILGILLFGGYAFQTFSLLYTTSGKSGFLTGVSVALVPIFAYFVTKSRISLQAATGALCALIGLYLLAFADFGSVNIGDVLAFLCSVFFAFQIIYTGQFSGRCSLLHLVGFQLLTVAVLSGVCSLLTEPWKQALRPEILLDPSVWSALLVTSVFATVLAFIAQTHVQKYTSPARVALIFSLEPVFAALADYVWLGVTLTGRALAGCLLIFGGMLLSELPAVRFPWGRKRHQPE
ncbi:DMT family transporter [Staphylospora marina]|uniref:DMT family transporter n=1 Tax=Staphylospora marina TaxID=2490858 RepID=UPI000F5B9051|nr:DMT family transporter [Staphylospora marina]